MLSLSLSQTSTQRKPRCRYRQSCHVRWWRPLVSCRANCRETPSSMPARVPLRRRWAYPVVATRRLPFTRCPSTGTCPRLVRARHGPSVSSRSIGLAPGTRPPRARLAAQRFDLLISICNVGRSVGRTTSSDRFRIDPSVSCDRLQVRKSRRRRLNRFGKLADRSIMCTRITSRRLRQQLDRRLSVQRRVTDKRRARHFRSQTNVNPQIGRTV